MHFANVSSINVLLGGGGEGGGCFQFVIMIMSGLLSPDLVVVMLLSMLVHDVILCSLQKHITFLSFTTSFVHVFLFLFLVHFSFGLYCSSVFMVGLVSCGGF
jgi:hypothetical protein